MKINFGLGISDYRLRGGGLDPDYQAVLTYAQSQGFTLPSAAEQVIANQLMVDLKAASSTGLSGYGLIKIYATNINYGGSIPANLGYTGINWASVGNNQSTRTNTITQTVKEGYSSDGATAYISETFGLGDLPQNDVFNSLYSFNLTGNCRNGVIDGGVTNGHLLQWNGTEWQMLLNGPLISKTRSSAGDNVFVSLVRTSSSNVSFYINGIKDSDSSNTSAPPLSNNDESMSVLVLPSTRVVQEAGNILSIRIKGKASEVNQLSLYTAINNYLTALSAL